MKKSKLSKRSRFWTWILMVVVLLMIWLTGDRSQLKAADYPTKPISVVVTWSAGGGQDIFARIAAARLSKKWGVPVNVINKPGGMGIPGTLETLQAKPDGYTILSESSASSSMLDAWGKDVPFDIGERTYLANALEYPFFFY